MGSQVKDSAGKRSSVLANFAVPAILITASALLVSLLVGVVWTEFYDEYAISLLIANSIGILVVGLLVAFLIGRMMLQRRQRIPGSRLAVKVLKVFTVLTLTTMGVVYFLTFFMIDSSLDYRFNVSAKEAVDEANQIPRLVGQLLQMNAAIDVKEVIEDIETTDDVGKISELLGEVVRRDENYKELTYYEDLAISAGYDVYGGAGTSDNSQVADSELSGGSIGLILPGFPEETDSQSERLADATPRFPGTIVSSGSQTGTLLPLLPDESLIQFALYERAQRQIVHNVDYSGDALPELHMLIPISREIGARDFLYVWATLPEEIRLLTKTIDSVNQKYNRIVIERDPTKLRLILMFTLITLAAVLLAIWGSIYFTDRLVEPIRTLFEGTRTVAEGNYEQPLPVTTRDDFGTLVTSFNHMMSEVNKSQKALETSTEMADKQRSYVETVMKHLSSGVLSIDEGGRLLNVNLAAEKILGVGSNSIANQTLSDLIRPQSKFQPLFSEIIKGIEEQLSGWDGTVYLKFGEEFQILVFRATRLPVDSSNRGTYVVVVEDVTELTKAQRGAAWGEFAKRLTHELRNPLQPIYNGVEIIQVKTDRGLPPSDQKSLSTCYDAIFGQLSAMKASIDKFRNLETLSIMRLQYVDFNELIRQTAVLYENETVKITLDTDPKLGKIRVDPDQLTQVFNNLIINSTQALKGVDNPVVTLQTRRIDSHVTEFCVFDNGTGFNAFVVDRLFEPYMTTKESGMGLGLVIVQQIVEGHGGRIFANNRPEGGAQIRILFDSRKVRVQDAASGPEILKVKKGKEKWQADKIEFLS